MAETTTSNTATPVGPGGPNQPRSTIWQTASRWTMIVVGLVFAALALLKLYNQFTLPSCEERRTTDTLKSIFKSKDVEVVSFSEIGTLSSAYREKTCRARLKSTTEDVVIEYRIYWEGWNVNVMVTKVG